MMSRFYKILFLGFFIFSASHMIYWKNYWKPELFFWDENYHIASAAKYLKHIYFMEPHPPLGKLLLALGEKLVGVNNGQTFGYEKFDLIPNEILNESFSFAGYRFFPALFAVFNVLIFSGIIFWLTGSYIFTAAFASLPLLDTALILQARAAMLESFLLFGQLICLLGFFIILKLSPREKKKITFFSFLMSFGFTFAYMTKLFGLALIVLWPLLYFLQPEKRKVLKKLYFFNFLFIAIFSLGIWTVHVQLGEKIQPSLVNRGTYFASSDYERWLLGLEKDSWTHLPQKIYENLYYIFHYETNVAGVDWDEHTITGSYPIGWPFGSRPIPYRWQQGGTEHRYLYLIPNPWSWGMGLLGFILALILWIRKGKLFPQNNPAIFSMVILYFSYFIPMCFISRVLYLYHYFPMLVITWILFALVLEQFSLSIPSWNKKISLVLCLMPFAMFHGYFMYRNFINYTPTECSELRKKNIFPFWGMKFASCDAEDSRKRFFKQFKGSEP